MAKATRHKRSVKASTPRTKKLAGSTWIETELADLIIQMDENQERRRKKEKQERQASNKKFATWAIFFLLVFMVVNIMLPLRFGVSQQAIPGLLILESLFVFAIAKGCGVTWVDGLFNRDSNLSLEGMVSFFEKFGKTK